MASDIETAIQYAKSVESLLVKQWGAQGKGLHEKLSSVEQQLPAALVKRIRYLATMRNKVVHEDDFNLPNRKSFIRSSETIIAQLNPPASVRPSKKLSIAIYACIASVFAAGIYIAVAT